MVHFVGAGPGSADLITVRGMRLLQKADLLIYTGSLINPELISFAPPEAVKLDSFRMSLAEITEAIAKEYECWHSGKRKSEPEIVRLQTGDISLYSAFWEQADELESRGIPYDICPGLGAFQASAAALNAEYTEPGLTQTVIISRVEGRTKMPQSESLRKLAGIGCTLVLYLSARYPRKLRDELIAGGLRADTAAAIVYKAGWAEEKVFRTTLGQVPQVLEKEGISNTALIIIGDVLNHEKQMFHSYLYSEERTTYRT